MWPPLELIHLVYHFCIGLNKFLIVACGMAFHSCYRAMVRAASVVQGLAMFFIPSPKTPHIFSIWLRIGDFAGQSVTSILAFSKMHGRLEHLPQYKLIQAHVMLISPIQFISTRKCLG